MRRSGTCCPGGEGSVPPSRSELAMQGHWELNRCVYGGRRVPGKRSSTACVWKMKNYCPPAPTPPCSMENHGIFGNREGQWEIGESWTHGWDQKAEGLWGFSVACVAGRKEAEHWWPGQPMPISLGHVEPLHAGVLGLDPCGSAWNPAGVSIPVSSRWSFPRLLLLLGTFACARELCLLARSAVVGLGL